MYRVSHDVRSTHSLEGGVALDTRQGHIFNLNFVGSRILELLKSGRSEPEIVETIRGDFGVGLETAEVDVQEFLRALVDHKLIEELTK